MGKKPKDKTTENEPVDVMFTMEIQHQCLKCKANFALKNKLHQHICGECMK